MKKTGFYVTPLEQEIFIKGNWTIENKTSFQRLKDEDTATMYLGGFANKHQIEFLKKVISDNPFVKYYHFGDIDIGGFLIHKHLCRETAKKFDLYCMGIQQLHDMRFRYCLRETLSTLNFIRKGMNLCIFGASDSGKTYLAELWEQKHAGNSVYDTIIAKILQANSPPSERRTINSIKKCLIPLSTLILSFWTISSYTRSRKMMR